MKFSVSRHLEDPVKMYHGQQEPKSAQVILNELLQAKWNSLIPKFPCDACHLKLESESAVELQKLPKH